MTSLNDKGENHFNSVIAPDLQHVEKQLFFVKLKPNAELPSDAGCHIRFCHSTPKYAPFLAYLIEPKALKSDWQRNIFW